MVKPVTGRILNSGYDDDRKSDVNNRDFKNNLRLMTILIFMLFQLPGQFRLFFTKSWELKYGTMLVPLSFSLCLLSYLVLELLEYYRWKYRYSDKKIPTVLFLVRFFLLAGVMVLTGITPDHPGLNGCLTLLIFYSYYVFPFPVSLSLCILTPLFIMFSEIDSGVVSGVQGQFSLFFATYKSLIIVMFYLFAYFWKKDRDISDENIKLVGELNQSEAQLREYAQRISKTVALEERTRLARDIHDSVGHALTAIQIQLSKAEAYYHLNHDESREAIREARESAREAMQDIRSSLGMLNEKELHFSLKENISSLAGRLKAAGYEVNLEYRGEDEGYNYAVIMAVFRLVQEGVTNILKHSGAAHVNLSLNFGPDEVLVVLEDDGRGFIPGDLRREEETHYGLNGLFLRMELVRGKLEIQSEPGQGCHIKARLPRDPVSLIGENHG